MADDKDGPSIGELYRLSGWPDHGVRWDTDGVGRWWLVAEKESEIVGAIQIISSQPFGYIGDIVIHPEEKARRKNGNSGLSKDFGYLAKMLYWTAIVMLERSGSQMVMGIVSEDQPALLHLLMKHGGVPLGNFTLLSRRLEP